MLTVIATPLGGLLDLFVLVPLGIVAGVYGVEYAAALRRRPRPGRRA